MPKHRFFTICYGIILVLLIIWLFTKVSFLLHPIVLGIQTLFVPFLIAGILYYLMRPIVDFLELKRVPRIISILLMFLAFIGVIISVSLAIGPILQQQIYRLIENAPAIADMLLEQWEFLQENRANFPDFVDEWIVAATEAVQSLLSGIGRNIMDVITGVTGFLFTLVIVPFILFYMLKDGSKLPDGIVKFIPSQQRSEAKKVLAGMNKALSTYVIGQLIVSLCVGIMVYIGYLIIGLEYSLLLAIVAMLTNVIPFVGPFIGTAPAIVVGLIDSPVMMLKVIIVVLVAQQIESNFISPQVMGRVLEVHPLTIILLILVAGSLFGLIGLILAVPVYAVSKVIVKHVYRLILLRNQSRT